VGDERHHQQQRSDLGQDGEQRQEQADLIGRHRGPGVM
jgi:hypothetical protein